MHPNADATTSNDAQRHQMDDSSFDWVKVNGSDLQGCEGSGSHLNGSDGSIHSEPHATPVEDTGLLYDHSGYIHPYDCQITRPIPVDSSLSTTAMSYSRSDIAAQSWSQHTSFSQPQQPYRVEGSYHESTPFGRIDTPAFDRGASFYGATELANRHFMPVAQQSLQPSPFIPVSHELGRGLAVYDQSVGFAHGLPPHYGCHVSSPPHHYANASHPNPYDRRPLSVQTHHDRSPTIKVESPRRPRGKGKRSARSASDEYPTSPGGTKYRVLPDYSFRFSNAVEAAQWLAPIHKTERLTFKDRHDDWQVIARDIQPHCAELFYALTHTAANAPDNFDEHQIKYYEDHQGQTLDTITDCLLKWPEQSEARVVLAVQAVLDVHMQELPSEVVRACSGKTTDPLNASLICSERMQQVIDAARKDKYVAYDILWGDPNCLQKLVWHPLKYKKGKIENTRVNGRKAHEQQEAKRRENPEIDESELQKSRRQYGAKGKIGPCERSAMLYPWKARIRYQWKLGAISPEELADEVGDLDLTGSRSSDRVGISRSRKRGADRDDADPPKKRVRSGAATKL